MNFSPFMIGTSFIATTNNYDLHSSYPRKDLAFNVKTVRLFSCQPLLFFLPYPSTVVCLMSLPLWPLVSCVIHVTLEAKGALRPLGGVDVACRMTECLSPEALEMVPATPTILEVHSPQISQTQGNILHLLFHLTSATSTWPPLNLRDQLVASTRQLPASDVMK